MSKLDSLGNEVSSLSQQLNEIESRVYGLDDRINRLPVRIDQIRKMNYRILTYLEKDQAAVSERWSAVGPGLKESVRSQAALLRPEVRALETEVSMRRMDTVYDLSRLGGIEIRLATLRIKVSDLDGSVTGTLGETGKKLESIEQDVSIAESTLNKIASASFPWKEGECPVLAIDAKDMKNDVEGVITMTNMRFLYESEKEVVLKKRLFIATEKKKVRELVIDQPVGIVDNITKGRVGLLAGQGLYIAFKPQSGLGEMKFDTKGNEADWTIRFYNLIASGQAEQEISATPGVPPPKPMTGLLVCPRCGAPYTDEVYRGQTSVQCRYCGAVIPLPQ
jgi:hypothetical protein